MISVGSRKEKRKASQSYMYNWTSYHCGKWSSIPLGNLRTSVEHASKYSNPDVRQQNIYSPTLLNNCLRIDLFKEHSNFVIDYLKYLNTLISGKPQPQYISLNQLIFFLLTVEKYWSKKKNLIHFLEIACLDIV